MTSCVRVAGEGGGSARIRLRPRLTSAVLCRLVLGTSNHPGGVLVCPNSLRLSPVAGQQGFLMCPGSEPMAFKTPKVSSGGHCAASPSAPAGAALPSLALLTLLRGGRCAELRGGVPSVQAPSSLPAPSLPLPGPAPTARWPPRGSASAPLGPSSAQPLPPWRCPPGGSAWCPRPPALPPETWRACMPPSRPRALLPVPACRPRGSRGVASALPPRAEPSGPRPRPPSASARMRAAYPVPRPWPGQGRLRMPRADPSPAAGA
eukprot:3400676-Heterocapsa_arctica.AAC.2